MSYFHTLPDHTVWPKPSACRELEHALRYGTPTKAQLMLAASVAAAYSVAMTCTGKRREQVAAFIRAKEKTEQYSEDSSK